MKKPFILFILLLIFATPYQVSAQTEAGLSLIISEVYLDEKNPEKNWIEVSNPTTVTLVLSGFRMSHILSLNQLPADIRKKGGINIQPGGYIVLAAEKNSISVSEKVELFVIEVLSWAVTGGFIAVDTGDRDSALGEAVRYGEPSLSTGVEKHGINQVVPFSKNGKSFSREATANDSCLIYNNFSESDRTPGEKNIKN